MDYGPLTTGLRTDRDRDSDRARKEKDSRQQAPGQGGKAVFVLMFGPEVRGERRALSA